MSLNRKKQLDRTYG